MIGALIPVKNLSFGKSRLSSALGHRERESLSIFMLRHVLQMLQDSARFDLIGLVTADERAAQIGREFGSEIVGEKNPGDLNRAVDHATAICQSLGAQSLLVLPADIPLLDTWDIERILAGLQAGARVVICPSKEGTGTNAILRTPPQVIPARFGRNSFALHCQAAKAEKILYEVLSLPRVAFDIDTPEDLRKWLKWNVGSISPPAVSPSMVR